MALETQTVFWSGPENNPIDTLWNGLENHLQQTLSELKQFWEEDEENLETACRLFLVLFLCFVEVWIYCSDIMGVIWTQFHAIFVSPVKILAVIFNTTC